MQYRKWLGIFLENEENQVQDFNDFVRQRNQYCGFPGIQAHNLSLDPVVVDPSLNDYHLLAGSPTINRGNASIAPLTDIDGRLRSQHYYVDMSAYEFVYQKTFLHNILRVTQGDINPTGLR